MPCTGIPRIVCDFRGNGILGTLMAKGSYLGRAKSWLQGLGYGYLLGDVVPRIKLLASVRRERRMLDSQFVSTNFL